MKVPRQVKQGKRVRYEGWDREWLYHQYVTLNKSTVEISAEFGPTHHAIWVWLKKEGISKSKEKIWANHSERMTGDGNPAWNGGTARNYQRRLLEREQPDVKCEWCGTRERVQVSPIAYRRFVCHNGGVKAR